MKLRWSGRRQMPSRRLMDLSSFLSLSHVQTRPRVSTLTAGRGTSRSMVGPAAARSVAASARAARSGLRSGATAAADRPPGRCSAGPALPPRPFGCHRATVTAATALAARPTCRRRGRHHDAFALLGRHVLRARSQSAPLAPLVGARGLAARRFTSWAAAARTWQRAVAARDRPWAGVVPALQRLWAGAAPGAVPARGTGAAGAPVHRRCRDCRAAPPQAPLRPPRLRPPRPPRPASGGGSRPSAVYISFVGRKRSAAFGTRSTSSRREISMLMFAVIPGFSLSSGFGHRDDRLVGDDVLLHLGFESHLLDRSREQVRSDRRPRGTSRAAPGGCGRRRFRPRPRGPSSSSGRWQGEDGRCLRADRHGLPDVHRRVR